MRVGDCRNLNVILESYTGSRPDVVPSVVDCAARGGSTAKDVHVAGNPVHVVKEDLNALIGCRFVQQVEEAWLWISIAPHVRGRLRAADLRLPSAGASLALRNRFPLGSPITCHVLKVLLVSHSLESLPRAQGTAGFARSKVPAAGGTAATHYLKSLPRAKNSLCFA